MRSIVFLGLAALVAACGGDEFSGGEAAGQGGQGGGAGGSAAGAAGVGAGGVAGQGGAAGLAGGGTAGAAPVCQNGKFKCDGGKLFACKVGQYELSSNCSANENDQTICNELQGKCVSCVKGEITGCSAGNDALLECDDRGKEKMGAACKDATPRCQKAVGEEPARCVECLVDDDCPKPEGECRVARCANNQCGTEDVVAGTVLKEQVVADCSQQVCDGNGGVTTESLASGKSCGNDGFCNGSGQCGVCQVGATECTAGQDYRTCGNDGQWQLPLKCPVATPVCGDQGKCVGVLEASVKANHACAVLTDGTVRCWGDNSSGQLGLGEGAPSSSLQPRPVVGLTGVKRVVTGLLHSCALKSDGTVWCWGANDWGQIGVDSTTPRFDTPQKILSDAKYTTLVSSSLRTCAVLESRKVDCWGKNAVSGWLTYPVPVKFNNSTAPGGLLYNVISLAMGEEHLCAVLDSGVVGCAGKNTVGQLGTGSLNSPDREYFKDQVIGFSEATKVVAGPYQTVAIVPLIGTSKANVYKWGRDESNQAKDVAVAQAQLIDTTWKIGNEFLFSDHFYGYLESGQLTLMGRNDSGQLGKPPPVPASDYDSNKVNLALLGGASLGNKTVCAWEASGRLWCWGKNSTGAVGNGDQSSYVITPTLVKW